ncbi:MAG: hypothetical protein AAF587_37185 [Bacteroidota bacterium]
MKLLPFTLGIPIGIFLVSMMGCNNGASLADNPMAEIARFVEENLGKRIYQYVDGEDRQESEVQWSRIEEDPSTNIFTSTEVYNTYQADADTKEYYVQQFSFNSMDTETRLPVHDFQFSANKGSYILTDSKKYELKLAEKLKLKIRDRIYIVYKLLGYAHVGDEEASHHKYWSPEFGTLLIWFGEQRFLEIIGLDNQASLNICKALIQQIKARIFSANP